MANIFKSILNFNATPSKQALTQELGRPGVTMYSGYVHEEFLAQLKGDKALKMYREMSDNDPTIGAVLTAIDCMARSVSWEFTPSDKDADNYYVDWLEEQIENMDSTFEEFLSECLTMLVFGWSFFEIIFKKNTDGTIGLQELAPRAQESRLRWEVDTAGNITGMVQQVLGQINNVTIPLGKAALFRTTIRKGNPEGRSVLRNAYTSYYYKKKIQYHEAVGIEYDLTGIPVVRVPSSVMESADSTVFDAYKSIAKNMKKNEQAGLVLPSTPYLDDQGRPTNIPQYSVELLSSSGTRTIDTIGIINRYNQDITRTVLADFLMLGSNGAGSYALSTDKTDVFLKSLQAMMNNIESTFKRQITKKLWALNGFDIEMIPEFKPCKIEPVDLGKLGTFLRDISSAGLIVADPETEKWIREQGGLPEASVDSTSSGQVDDDFESKGD